MRFPDSHDESSSCGATARSYITHPNLILKLPFKRFRIMVVTFLRASPIQQELVKNLTKNLSSAPHYSTEYSNNRDASAKIATSKPVVSVPPFAFLGRRRGKLCYSTISQICNLSNRDSHLASLLLGLYSTLHPCPQVPQHPDFLKNYFSQHNTPAGLSGCQPLWCPGKCCFCL